MNEAVIIGGGFYGSVIADYLIRSRGLKRIILCEQESALLTRASYNNQARVHNGYHYPRSYTTAYRSRVNLPKFVNEWPDAVKTGFTKLYAISRRNSKVNAKQFVRFCSEISADITNAKAQHHKLFNKKYIEDIFLVKEYAFDAQQLSSWATSRLAASGVDVRLNTSVTAIAQDSSGALLVTTHNGDGIQSTIASKLVFNCSYSGLNSFTKNLLGANIKLKHEITEMGLMQVPDELYDIGVTVMDGPFFSMMPFPARELHTLSHVRYTPHLSWQDTPQKDPYKILDSYNKQSRVDRMVRDVSRYMPLVEKSKHIDSLFEIKTTLEKNEDDDGRPILYQRHSELPGCISILGGKIDNIFDILEQLDSEALM